MVLEIVDDRQQPPGCLQPDSAAVRAANASLALRPGRLMEHSHGPWCRAGGRGEEGQPCSLGFASKGFPLDRPYNSRGRRKFHERTPGTLVAS